jgi:acylphosphatase
VSALLHVRVDGRVQGVGFRWFVREEATRLGLAGWVRNLPDGSVEVCAAGEADSIDALRGALGRGPAGARVATVADVPAGTASPTGAFEIRRG